MSCFLACFVFTTVFNTVECGPHCILCMCVGALSNANKRQLRGCRTCIIVAVLQPDEPTACRLGNCQPSRQAAVRPPLRSLSIAESMSLLSSTDAPLHAHQHSSPKHANVANCDADSTCEAKQVTMSKLLVTMQIRGVIACL